MKKIILFLTTLLVITSVFGQEVSVTWGESEKLTAKSSAPTLIGSQDGKIYVLKSDNAKELGDYYINSYDETNLTREDKIVFETLFPKDIQKNMLEKIILLNGNIVVISSNKEKELIGTIIDLEGKLLKGKLMIDKVAEKDKDFEGFEVLTSGDKSKIMSYRRTKGTSKKSCAYSFTMYGSDLKRIGSSRQELPYEEDNFKLLRSRLNNRGELMMVARIKVEGSRRKFDTYKAVLMSLDMSQEKPQLNEVNLPFEKRIAASMEFFINNNNSVTVLGTYANSKDDDNVEGIFKIELEQGTFRLISSTYEKFMKGLQSRDNNRSKMEPGVCFDYELMHYFINSRNEKFLVFENRASQFVYYSSSTNKSVSTLDIIVVKLGADDKIMWNSLIFKNQFLQIPYSQTMQVGFVGITIPVYRIYKKYEDLLSYACLFKNDNLYFVFNDHQNNMQVKFADKPFNSFKKSYSALVTLNCATGKWEKKTIFTKKEAELLVTPQNSKQISDNKILTFSFEDDKQGGIGYIMVE